MHNMGVCQNHTPASGVISEHNLNRQQIRRFAEHSSNLEILDQRQQDLVRWTKIFLSSRVFNQPSPGPKSALRHRHILLAFNTTSTFTKMIVTPFRSPSVKYHQHSLAPQITQHCRIETGACVQETYPDCSFKFCFKGAVGN